MEQLYLRDELRVNDFVPSRALNPTPCVNVGLQTIVVNLRKIMNLELDNEFVFQQVPHKRYSRSRVRKFV